MCWFPCFFKICAEEGRVSCEFGPEGPLLESARLLCTCSDWDPAETWPADNAKGKNHGKRKEEVTFNPGRKKKYFPDVSFAFESPGGIHV